MLILDGKTVSEVHRERIRKEALEFSSAYGRRPHLVVVLVGEFGPSQVYVRNKARACEAVGFHSTRIDLPATTTIEELRKILLSLNTDEAVDGVLVQLPLPKQIPEQMISETLDPQKDVDGLTYNSLGRFLSGHPLAVPCTPKGVMSILRFYKIPVEGQTAAVIGRSNIVGKPMAHLLVQASATVTICHSKTNNLASITRLADVVVVAAGQRAFFGREYFKENGVVIDVGIHGSGGTGEKIVGDVRIEELFGWSYAATPVPGGVGPMTITGLLENTLMLAKNRLATGHSNKGS